MASASFSLVFPIPTDLENPNQFIEQWQTVMNAHESVHELFLLNGGGGHSFSEKALEQGKEKVITVLNCETHGEGLQEAAKKAEAGYLLTMTELEVRSPQLLDTLLAEIPFSSLESNIADQTILALSKKQANANKPVHPKQKNLNWYKALTTLRSNAPLAPLKLYPTKLACYLFNKTSSHSPCFQVESTHRAEMEGVHITEERVDTSGEQSMVPIPTFTKWQAFKRAVAFKVRYQLLEPLKVIFRQEHISSPGGLGSPNYYSRLGFTLVLATLFLLMPILSLDHGATWDEYFVEKSANKLTDFYLTFGEDKSALEYRNRKFYGGLFDTYSGFAVKIFNPLFDQDYTYQIRHIFNALIGFLGILFTGLLGKYLGGWRGGLMALLFIALSPRFFGHAMNNPKDIPFAAAFAMGTYFMVKTIREFPFPSKRTVFWFIFAIACAISIRIGGLLLINYFGLFIIIYVLNAYLVSGNTPFSKFHLKRGFWVCLIVTVFGYFGGLIFWPYGLRGPIEHPFDALAKMSDFDNAVSTWFEGQMMKSDQLPWYYIFKYLGITSPLFIIVGFAILIGWSIYRVSKQRRNEYLMVLFTVFFPIGFIIAKGSNVYDGMRQLLFIYPSLVVVASQSWLHLLNGLNHRLLRIFSFGLLGFLLILPLSFIVRNHPHEYVYYNQIIGGVKGAYGNYELDYWGNASKEAFQFLGPYLQKNHHKDSTIQVNTNYLEPEKEALYRYQPNINWHKTKLERMEGKDWDYGIFIARWFPLDYIEKGKWPPKNTIHKITVDGVPIAVVTKSQEKQSNKARTD